MLKEQNALDGLVIHRIVAGLVICTFRLDWISVK
jgi:hypothetical protein